MTYLICEGDFDERMVTAVLHKQGITIETIPAYGTKNLGAVRTYLQEQAKSHPFYTIRDRDYSSFNEAKQSWQAGSTQFMWHRHEIENYLLDNRVIARAFAAINQSPLFKPKATPLPENPHEMLAILQDIARPLLAHHAAQIVCQQLDLKVRLGTMACGDKIPLQPEKCLDYLQAQLADRKVNNETLTRDIVKYETDLKDKYHQLLQQVLAPTFLQPGENGFLYDVGGKELIKALCVAKINPVLKAPLGIDDFTELLFESFQVEADQPDFIWPDDFVTLAQRLQPQKNKHE